MKLRFLAYVVAFVVLVGIAFGYAVGGSQEASSRATDGSKRVGSNGPLNAERSLNSIAEYDKMFKDVSNWGRWGKDDELGTANLITNEKRKQAATLVKSGIAVSLSHTELTEKAPDLLGEPGKGGGPFLMTGGGGTFTYTFHSTTHSHMDAICQYDHQGLMYNGFNIKDSKGPNGCSKSGLELIKNGLTTRGVLIDIPRLKGVPYLNPGDAVYPEDVEAWEKKAGVKVGAGDAIFLRTGRWARRAKLGPWVLHPVPPGPWDGVTGEAGWHVSMVPWFKKRDVAIVGADDSNDVSPSGAAEEVLKIVRRMPVHSLTITALGAYVFDAMDPEAAAETAAKLNRWEFMLTGAPLAVKGANGSLVNMIAIF